MDLRLGINREPGTQGRNKTHQNIDGISQRRAAGCSVSIMLTGLDPSTMASLCDVAEFGNSKVLIVHNVNKILCYLCQSNLGWRRVNV